MCGTRIILPRVRCTYYLHGNLHAKLLQQIYKHVHRNEQVHKREGGGEYVIQICEEIE